MNELGNSTGTPHPDVRVSATNFGPIASGTIDLRPLTVFVGPSNTGKTYFAILLYALHRVLGGFPRLPRMRRHRYPFLQGQPYKPASDAEVQQELQDFFKKLEVEGRTFRFSDLPTGVRDAAQTALTDPDFLGAFLQTELGRCFDLESVADLVRFSGHANRMEVALTVSEQDQDLWRFRMETAESGVTTDGQIEDIVLLPAGLSESDYSDPLSTRFRELIKEIQGTDLPLNLRYKWKGFHEELSSLTDSARERETHYLPAARSGIMQSHRVIASSLVGRSTQAGMEHFPELPTFSGVMADFMQRLILYEESRATNRPTNALADALEREVLAGRIQAKISRPGGYPEFVYRPQDTEEDIRLTRASSMVSELAPVVLFLRGAVGRGDMVIIEEPEAHLHPAAQTQMAVALARMIHTGLRVVVTTHSDWLLKEIGNLMREGELGEKTGEPTNEEILPSSLRPSEVGIWLFRKDGTSGSTVEEIPFDRIEGVEPDEYEDVAEELYNRSANLQNQLEGYQSPRGRGDEGVSGMRADSGDRHHSLITEKRFL